jgi:hypothetical protein
MPVYTTYFDTQFLIRGAACLRSLLAQSRVASDIRVLALDDFCAAKLPEIIGPLPLGTSLTVETLAVFEARHPELASARANRPRVEYLFTLTPFLCADALAATAPGEWCVYLDADTYFFAAPELALEGLKDAQIAITEHRFPQEKAALATLYGKFNVGWLAFRAGSEADACVASWAADCLQSCSLTPAAGCFGDQKYLDSWPEQFSGVAIVDHPGLNTAPWNAARHHFSRPNAMLLADERPLILFHFHRLTMLAPGLYETDYLDYGTLSPTLRSLVYPDYISALDKLWKQHGESLPPSPAREMPAGNPLRRWAKKCRAALRLFSRHRVLFVNGRALSPFEGITYG